MVFKQGQIAWNKGKKGIYSQETREHWSKVRKGRKLSPAHLKRILEARKGYKHSLETKKKMSLKRLARKRRFGYLNSPETRKKIRLKTLAQWKNK